MKNTSPSAQLVEDHEFSAKQVNISPKSLNTLNNINRLASSSQKTGGAKKSHVSTEAKVYTGISKNLKELLRAEGLYTRSKPGELHLRCSSFLIANYVERHFEGCSLDLKGEFGSINPRNSSSSECISIDMDRSRSPPHIDLGSRVSLAAVAAVSPAFAKGPVTNMEVVRYNKTVERQMNNDFSENEIELLKKINTPRSSLSRGRSKSVDMEKITEPLQDHDLLILDIRAQEDYDQCHIIGAHRFQPSWLSHPTNPFGPDPELRQLIFNYIKYNNYNATGAKKKSIVLYDLEEELVFKGKVGNLFFEKASMYNFDLKNKCNIFAISGGLREFAQSHADLLTNSNLGDNPTLDERIKLVNIPVDIIPKNSHIGMYAVDRNTVGSHASRSSVARSRC